MTVVTFVGTKRAVKFDLTVEQGTDLDFPITVLDEADVERNFASYTARMQIRAVKDSDTVLWEMTTANGKITTGDGKITLHFLNTDFVGVDWTDGEYDLEVVSALSRVERILEGHFHIDTEVTR